MRELCASKPTAPGNITKKAPSCSSLIDAESRGTLWLLAHTYSALLARIESLDFARFRRTRASLASGKNVIHRPGPFRARDGREHP